MMRFADCFWMERARWSPLTPVIGGEISHPAPLALVYMKNEGVYANRCTEAPAGKQKTLVRRLHRAGQTWAAGSVGPHHNDLSS